MAGPLQERGDGHPAVLAGRGRVGVLGMRSGTRGLGDLGEHEDPRPIPVGPRPQQRERPLHRIALVRGEELVEDLGGRRSLSGQSHGREPQVDAPQLAPEAGERLLHQPSLAATRLGLDEQRCRPARRNSLEEVAQLDQLLVAADERRLRKPPGAGQGPDRADLERPNGLALPLEREGRDFHRFEPMIHASIDGLAARAPCGARPDPRAGRRR